MTSAPKAIRVLLCNRQTLVRDGLQAILENYAQIEIVGQAATIAKSIHKVQHLHPDVVLMDADLADSNGSKVLERILAIDPQVRILLLSLSATRKQVRQCIRAGAVREIGPETQPAQLKAAILRAVAPRRPALRRIAAGAAAVHEERRFRHIP